MFSIYFLMHCLLTIRNDLPRKKLQCKKHFQQAFCHIKGLAFSPVLIFSKSWFYEKAWGFIVIFIVEGEK